MIGPVRFKGRTAARGNMPVGQGDGIFFVWLATAGDPTPQLWYGDQSQVNGKSVHRMVASVEEAEPGDMLAKHVLTLDQIKLYGFGDFVEMYPSPGRKRHGKPVGT